MPLQGGCVNAALWLLWVAPLTAAAQAADGEGTTWAHDALAQAVVASSGIEDDFRLAQTLAEIAEIQVGVENGTAALPILQKAADSASKVDNESLAAWARHDVALAYVKAGDLARAESVANGIRDARLHDAVLGAIVDARRMERDIPGALDAARRMQDAALQGRALRSVVIAQASAGDTEAALATARSVVHPGFNALALGDVVAAFAKEGNLGEARLLAARIRNDQVRSDAQAEIAAAQANMGDKDGALVTASKIEDKFSRAGALARLATARASHGDGGAARELFAQAVALAQGARGTADRKCFALVDIARAQIAAVETPAAHETLRLALTVLPEVKRNSDHLALLAQIAPMQARVGDHAGAMATAGRAEDPSLRPLLVRDVATSQAESGDVAGAVRAALSLEDRPAGAAAFFGILRVQSQARDSSGMHATIETALQTVRVIHSEALKAGALSSLAAAQLLAGDRDGALLLFDEAMKVAAQLQSAAERAAAYARIADALAERGR